MNVSDSQENFEPPSFPTRFVRWSLPNALKEPVLGDLSEEFFELSKQQNRPAYAHYWYWRQCLRSGLQFLWQTKRGLMMFILSISVFVGFTLMAMWMGGGLSLYVDLPSLLVVTAPAIFFTLAATSLKDLKLAVLSVLNHDAAPTNEDRARYCKVFAVLGNSSVFLAVLYFFINLIALASNIDVEFFSQVLGPALAVSFIAVVYGLFIKILCYVAQQKIGYIPK